VKVFCVERNLATVGFPIPGATAADWAMAERLGIPPEDLLCSVWRDAYLPMRNTLRCSQPHRFAKKPSRETGYVVERWADWQGHYSTAAEREAWALNPNLNLMVNARRIRAIDIDVEEAAAGLCSSWRRLAGSEALVRGRHNSQRVLLPFRLIGDPPLKGSVLAANSGAVEVLADGKCFVLAGGHASGVRYSHSGSRIPTLSLEQLYAYLATVGLMPELGDVRGTSSLHFKSARV